MKTTPRLKVATFLHQHREFERLSAQSGPIPGIRDIVTMKLSPSIPYLQYVTLNLIPSTPEFHYNF